ncbi:hypothetical protein [Sessilibacter sp. MAH2]
MLSKKYLHYYHLKHLWVLAFCCLFYFSSSFSLSPNSSHHELPSASFFGFLDDLPEIDINDDQPERYESYKFYEGLDSISFVYTYRLSPVVYSYTPNIFILPYYKYSSSSIYNSRAPPARA